MAEDVDVIRTVVGGIDVVVEVEDIEVEVDDMVVEVEEIVVDVDDDVVEVEVDELLVVLLMLVLVDVGGRDVEVDEMEEEVVVLEVGFGDTADVEATGAAAILTISTPCSVISKVEGSLFFDADQMVGIRI